MGISLKKDYFRYLVSNYGALLLLIILCIFLSIQSPRFMTWNNITNILRTVSIIGIISVGQTFVILGKGIDLSVGATVALVSMVTGVLLKDVGLNVPSIIFIALLLGAFIGALNGVVVTKLKVPDLIATIGVMEIVRGCAYVFWGGSVIVGFPQSFLSIGRSSFLGIPLPIIYLLLVTLLGIHLLGNTVLGKNILAIGGNRRAATLSGISWTKYKIISYIISGITASIASIILISRLNASQAVLGQGYELETVAAVVLGGTSLFGGKGSVYGSLIGALVIAVMRNGMVLLGVQFELQMVFLGIVLILSVAASTLD